jgi:mono/diheme cytochrome c family protein
MSRAGEATDMPGATRFPRRARHCILTITAAVLLTAGAAGFLTGCGQQDASSPQGAGTATGASALQRGAARFQSVCASCHGAGGRGGGPGSTLDSQQFLTTVDDAAMTKLIENGGGFGMPAYAHLGSSSLTGAQIGEIVVYLRSLQPKAPSVPGWKNGDQAR